MGLREIAQHRRSQIWKDNRGYMGTKLAKKEHCLQEKSYSKDDLLEIS